MRLDANKLRHYKELGGYLVLVVVSSVGAWLLPDKHRTVVLGLLVIGIGFDLLSLFYHVMTMVTGKFMSGFPLVGLFFYAWFLLTSRFSIVGRSQTELGRLLLFKFADLALLLAFHGLCQLPMFLQKPRSEYK